MTVRFYIAGAGAEAAKVKALATWVERFGGDLTVRWWDAVLSSTVHDRDLDDVTAEAHAAIDLEGVRQSHVFWLVVPEEKVGAGCYFEAGYLVGARDFWSYVRPKMIVSGDSKRSIFLRSTALFDHRFASHADALAWIQQTIMEAA